VRTGAILLKQFDGWITQRARNIALETIGAVSNSPHVSLPAVIAGHGGPTRRRSARSHNTRWRAAAEATILHDARSASVGPWWAPRQKRKARKTLVFQAQVNREASRLGDEGP